MKLHLKKNYNYGISAKLAYNIYIQYQNNFENKKTFQPTTEFLKRSYIYTKFDAYKNAAILHQFYIYSLEYCKQTKYNIYVYIYVQMFYRNSLNII